jgi:hypothetical protein
MEITPRGRGQSTLRRPIVAGCRVRIRGAGHVNEFGRVERGSGSRWFVKLDKGGRMIAVERWHLERINERSAA